MTVADPHSYLEVAIVGGGIAGLTAAIALSKHAGVRVQVYERTKEFREVGASISLAPNGLRVLEKLGVDNVLDGDVCTRQASDYPMIYRHWQTGELIAVDRHRTVTTKRHFTARYHRAHLHQALLANVDPAIVNMGKKTVDVRVHEDGVTISFEDGTTAHADICIGADGIHSNVRKTFVPDHTLYRSGWVAIRSAFDASNVRDIEFPQDATHWIGPDRTFFQSYLGKGKFTVVGSFDTDPESNDIAWEETWNMDAFRELYKDWHPSVRALIDAAPSTRLFPNMAGRALEKWTFADRVTMVGDAAHTHGGTFAAGGSLAIDDCYAFLLALQHVWPVDSNSSAPLRKPTPAQRALIFQLYQATRKPHIDKILAAVKSQVIGQKGPQVADDEDPDEVLRNRLRKRPDVAWISEHDVESAFRAALVQVEMDEVPVPKQEFDAMRKPRL